MARSSFYYQPQVATQSERMLRWGPKTALGGCVCDTQIHRGAVYEQIQQARG